MRDLAHVAYWTNSRGTIGSATLTPYSAPFERWLTDRETCTFYTSELHILALFSSSELALVVDGIVEHFPRHMCPICIRLGGHAPCWHWQECRTLWPSGVGGPAVIALRKPTSPEEELATIAHINPNALNRLLDSSADLRGALNPPLAPRRRERVTAAGIQTIVDPVPAATAPTPVGTIRCTTCHQVIPKGFEKAKDTKKTEDEIYAECAHEFTHELRTCTKCGMTERKIPNRFTLLEVD